MSIWARFHRLVKGIMEVQVLQDGSYALFAYSMARLIGTFALVYLFVASARTGECIEWVNRAPFIFCPEDSLTITFVYCVLLAAASLSPNTRLMISPVNLYNAIVLAALGVYYYRDLWPLATYNLQPIDAELEGNMIWFKIAILTTVGVIIPFLQPHPYIPVDPKAPSSELHPEQTASWSSLFTYTFMDPTVRLASKVPHLRHDQLPQLADYDHAQYLTTTAAKYIDTFSGAKDRHIFFGLIEYLYKEYLVIALCLSLMAASSFATPIGINKTLNYLEGRHHGIEPSIKPWVWISLMLLGPISKSLVENWGSYVLQTKVNIRIQALIRQLVFEHSLRIRMNADTEELESVEDDAAQAQSDAGTIVSVAANTDGAADDGAQTTDGSVKVDSSLESTEVDSDDEPTRSQKETASEHSVLPPSKKPPVQAKNLIGKLNNLVTSDLFNIVECGDFLTIGDLFHHISVSNVRLEKPTYPSSIVGLVVSGVLGPGFALIGKKVQKVQKIRIQFTDARIQAISEAMGVIRMIKMFGWEDKMAKRLARGREMELNWIWKAKVLEIINNIVASLIPTISMFVTFAVYTGVMKERLTASKIFSSSIVFGIFRQQISNLSRKLVYIIQGEYVAPLIYIGAPLTSHTAKVSLDRVNSFLRETELLDRFTEGTNSSAAENTGVIGNVAEVDIGIRNASFTWGAKDIQDVTRPSPSRNFRLRIVGDLIFKRGCVNLITGPTGSGKTSMLMALLGEMHFIADTQTSWVKLPRQGGVAYAAQESWVQNATIKENILFGSAFDEERYKKVIHQCALEKDLELFEAGDNTEVGERGLTVSGGQKARLTLARAIYSLAEIILLDDVLAALDVHTSVWIIEKCFWGDLVKGRTVLLVTHNITLAKPIASLIVKLGLDGSINIVHKNSNEMNPEDVSHSETGPLSVSKDNDASTSQPVGDGKLVMAEEIVEGRVTWRSISLFLSGLGGDHPIFFALLWIASLAASQGFYLLQPWYLGVWGSQYETHAPSEIHLSYYLLGFSAIIILRVILNCLTACILGIRAIRASRVIHYKLIDSVLGSTLRWLDETPTGRIISRCTGDIETVDFWMIQSVQYVVDMSAGMLATLATIVLFTPVFVIPGIIAAFFGVLLGNLYLKTQLSMNREMSNARSPLLAHFSAAMQGLVSIRAYGAQRAFSEESLRRIDFHSRADRASTTMYKWINVRVDILGAVFTSSLAFYLVYVGDLGASNTGFSLNFLERIQGYLDIEHESKPTQTGEPPAAWPTSGEIRVEGLSAKYSKSGPNILHDLSFHILSGQRVGVVGRTGSGKSSLTLALLRCILTEGTVLYDGLDTSTINLDALRSNITIIPQVPELLSGTLRQNLDPFDQHDDNVLNDALQSSGLFSIQERSSENVRLNLETQIAGGGSNLSVGQRQIIALARAMVRKSKLLILDEATSAIGQWILKFVITKKAEYLVKDYNTDSLIQNTLRSKLGSDVTVIIVAHRLQTIMDADKIMVLDNGKIAELDTPKTLLSNNTGMLHALVERSADKEMLYELAEKKSYVVPLLTIDACAKSNAHN
uniref:P-loop containing nucleoside triphosphate hydrolase protein n=1 Tax=Psilocybe cubensis TaxID=181762 RepID=A0A8H7XSA6_PSICU